MARRLEKAPESALKTTPVRTGPSGDTNPLDEAARPRSPAPREQEATAGMNSWISNLWSFSLVFHGESKMSLMNNPQRIRYRRLFSRNCAGRFALGIGEGQIGELGAPIGCLSALKDLLSGMGRNG